MSTSEASSGGTHRTKGPESEAEFLSRQADEAAAAFAQALAEFREDLARGLDVRLWAQRYPWLSLGAAAGLGFAAAWGLVPSADRRALRRLAHLERELLAPVEQIAAAQRQGSGESFLGRFLSQTMKALQPAIASAVAAAAGAKLGQRSEHGPGNGRAGNGE